MPKFKVNDIVRIIKPCEKCINWHDDHDGYMCKDDFGKENCIITHINSGWDEKPYTISLSSDKSLSCRFREEQLELVIMTQYSKLLLKNKKI